MSYRKDSFEGDELDRMRARQQRKKQGRPAAPAGDSYDLRPDQIEELDLDDYDTYEIALKQELNRTIAQTKQEQKNPNRKENRNAMRQDRAVYERPRKKRKKKHSFGKILLLVVCLFAVIFLYRHFRAGGYWTIAVFGVDSRDGNLGKGALSDVEMLASINKKTGEIRLVSVFRDSYLHISEKENDYDKINEAYFLGGHEQAVKALERNLNLHIDDYATFNWKAVVDAINVLGGVDIEISDKEFAYINSFITETVNSTGVGSYQLEHSGMNHLDGVQAVAYARLRLMDTDFNRTERQRKVLGQAMEKAKNSKFKTLRTLVGAVYPQISTSIGVDDVLALAKGAKKYYIGQTSGFPFSHQEMKIGKKSCVIPTTLESNVVQLHMFLYDQEQYDAPASVKEISNYIAKKTGLGDPGKDTETGKNIGVEGNNGGGQTGGKSEQPAAAPAQMDPAVEESSEAAVTSSESAEETMESSEAEETKETETSSGVISAPQDRPGSSETTASDHTSAGPGPSAGPGSSTNGPGTSNAPTAAETNAALEAPGQNSGSGAEEAGPGV
ncbi:LCP family protein [Clostridium sp. AM33-3]|uniref:LCP family protein n=1 Tax=Clostridium sp. AM33-3 TaxID=2292304 RepID=UPI001FA94A94|nr:LCP family protein [Clostridium sp. AM33-3]